MWYGTASTSWLRKAVAVLRLALASSRATATLLARSIATNRCNLPSAVRTSVMSKWK